MMTLNGTLISAPSVFINRYRALHSDVNPYIKHGNCTNLQLFSL
uniref:Uncharacterized protein n=1 Tax=Anguilla anguilla TaxID=7936 RepID=A0A0E9SI73_ANGAN